VNYQQVIADAINQTTFQITAADAATTGSGLSFCSPAVAATMVLAALAVATIVAVAATTAITASAAGSGLSFCSAAAMAATMAVDVDANQ